MCIAMAAGEKLKLDRPVKVVVKTPGSAALALPAAGTL